MIMKNRTVLYLLLFSILIGLKTELIQGQNTPIYEIHSNKGKAILVINTHKIDSSLFHSTLSKNQLEGIDRLILAHHPDSISYQYQRLYTEKGFYKDNDHIKNHLPKKLFKNLDKRFTELGLPLGHHPRMKPWLMTKSLYNLELKNSGLEEDRVAPYFMRKAQALNWTISIINNEDKKLAALYQLSEKDQIKVLKRAVKTSENRLSAIKKTAQEWNKNTLQKIPAPKIIKKQNRHNLSTWFKAIEASIASKETPLLLLDFQDTETINGLIKRLKKEGFRIQAL